MAAILPVIDGREDELNASGFQGARHRRFYFAAIDNDDTWVHGLDGLRVVAGEGEIGVTFSGTTITFHTDAGTKTGYCHTWSRS